MPTTLAAMYASIDDNDRNIVDIEYLRALGVSEHDAESYLAWRSMEIDEVETEISRQRLTELRTRYGAELLAQVR